MTMLSSGPPIRFMKCASSVTESGGKPSGIPEQTFRTPSRRLRFDGRVHPQVDDSAGEPAGARARIAGPKEIVHRPVQVRYVKAVAPDGLAEINQSLREIHQQRIPPANAAVSPLADALPISAGQTLVVLLGIAITMLQHLVQ